MKLLSSMWFRCVSAFFCLLRRRKAVISSLRSQKHSSALPLDSHWTSLYKSRLWCSADISDSSMWNKQCWRLDVERIKLIIAITLSIVVLSCPLSFAHKDIQHNSPVVCPSNDSKPSSSSQKHLLSKNWHIYAQLCGISFICGLIYCCGHDISFLQVF